MLVRGSPASSVCWWWQRGCTHKDGLTRVAMHPVAAADGAIFQPYGAGCACVQACPLPSPPSLRACEVASSGRHLVRTTGCLIPPILHQTLATAEKTCLNHVFKHALKIAPNCFGRTASGACSHKDVCFIISIGVYSCDTLSPYPLERLPPASERQNQKGQNQICGHGRAQRAPALGMLALH